MKNFDERLQSVQNKALQLRKDRKRKRLVALSCAGVFAVALLLTLFVPYSTTPPSVAQYKDSPYYGVIQKLNAYNFQMPKYKNNFQALVGGLSSLKNQLTDELYFAPGAMNGAASPETGDSNNQYVEVTDNQVAGVIEADIFKRTDTHIFHLYGRTLMVYEIAGEESKAVFSADVNAYLPELVEWYSDMQMYLSQDGQTLTLVLETSSKQIDNAVVLLNLDVSDPTDVRTKDRILFYGYDAQTRMVDGDLLLNYTCYTRSNPDYEDPDTYVPKYGWMDDWQYVSGDDILCPDTLTSRVYNVLVKLDGDTLEVKDTKALLSYSSEIYVSQENIYTTSSSWQVIEENALGDQKQRLMTTVTCIGYSGDSLEIKGSFAVEGSVLNQYSMDEQEGYFRIVTSTQNDRLQKNYSGNAVPDIYWESGQKSANLYVMDMTDWSVAGAVEGFAPAGEEVTSVRFEGSNAYVCTALRQILMDPVYFFDLSDPANIRWTDTGEIDGFSSSLINFGNGNLIGIGYNDWLNLKIEVYREVGEKVESVCSFEPELEYYFSEEYKSYYIDRENQLIGLSVWSYKEDELQYILLHFDGSQLIIEKQLKLPDFDRNTQLVRADIIDGFLYILSKELTITPVAF